MELVLHLNRERLRYLTKSTIVVCFCSDQMLTSLATLDNSLIDPPPLLSTINMLLLWDRSLALLPIITPRPPIIPTRVRMGNPYIYCKETGRAFIDEIYNMASTSQMYIKLTTTLATTMDLSQSQRS